MIYVNFGEIGSLQQSGKRICSSYNENAARWKNINKRFSIHISAKDADANINT